MSERNHSYGQQVDNTTILLYNLASLCLEHMDQELLGRSHKHGYLQNAHINPELTKDYREHLVEIMVDLLQELGMTQADIATAWDVVVENRKGRDAFIQEAKAKGWVK